ncbi:S1C family serine protease [Chitinophaga japonensis]|uniref:S1-C subfamily serine protease n=1 Tax=Chitinophaga japonensis TaxID=104662 RepID=A0A562T4G9_CHIJA|nr:S1C family serine protease [Chitinophaga japonensis]TWI88429.1 S1-C subfamily serine protease [Chitinophaga japonensis]
MKPGVSSNRQKIKEEIRMKDQLHLLQEIERYFEGHMSDEERAAFEALRLTDPEVDRQVEEQLLFLETLQQYGQRKDLQNKMDQIHAAMGPHTAAADGMPERPVMQPLRSRTPVTRRRALTNLAAAACIALVTSLTTIAIMQQAAKRKSTAQYEDVRRVLNNIQRSQNALINDINSNKKAPANPGTYGGTGFAISANGYIITNYHVVAGADSLYVQNNKGEAFKASSIFEDISSDLAILKIADSTFKSQPLPYALKPQQVRLGEEVFTMGYPRDEIVYGKGYISAQTGFNGDTVAYQVAIPVNPGNSGAPLMDNEGNIVGIITGKQTSSDGIAFAVKSAHLKRLLEEMPKEKLPRREWTRKNHLEHLPRVDQIRKLEDFVYMVKVYN